MSLYSMLQVLSGVKAEIVSNVLPKELSVVVNDLSANMHTHMLAVYSCQVPAATKCWVMLFLTHNIILASHCANLAILQSSAPATPQSVGKSISIPIVPLHSCTRGLPPTLYLPLHQVHQPSPCNPATFGQHLHPSTLRTP